MDNNLENNENNFFLKKTGIIFLSLLGILTTIKLAVIYFEANFNPYALPSFCSINEFIDCDGVAQTTFAQFLGIPLAYWGLFFYFVILFMVFVDKIQNIKFLGFLKVFKNPLDYIASLGFISFTISMVLAGISIFEIKKLCILCVCTYFIDLFIALVATDFKSGILKPFKQSLLDFMDAVKVKKYLISFIVLVIAGIGFLTYTEITDVFCPQVARYKEFKHYEQLSSDNPFGVKGNILGDKNAKLIVYIYSDYQCPMCKTYNVILERVASELSGVQIVHKNLPLDMECNKNITMPFHENSCKMARYVYAAKLQGRFWPLNDELFDKQPKTEEGILKIAKEAGFNIIKLKADANSTKAKDEVQKDIEDSVNLNIDGTPALVINGKKYTGIKPYYDLKQLLIKAGAVEKAN